MRIAVENIIFAAGIGQLCVLTASALVPVRLGWKTSFQVLPRLCRQLYWVYGGYVVLAIISFGVICVLNAEEIARGTLLGRCVCGYLAVFWGTRLSLQAVLDVEPYLTSWSLKAGYHTLTILFAGFALIFAWAAIS
jgi:hypothetical protein